MISRVELIRKDKFRSARKIPPSGKRSFLFNKFARLSPGTPDWGVPQTDHSTVVVLRGQT